MERIKENKLNLCEKCGNSNLNCWRIELPSQLPKAIWCIDCMYENFNAIIKEADKGISDTLLILDCWTRKRSNASEVISTLRIK